jgi:hypothetical protein
LRVAFVLVLAELAAGAEVQPLDTDFIIGDLGESDGIGGDDMLGEAESAYLSKEAGDYSATKTKLEAELKAVKEDLKKKKAKAKSDYDRQVADFSKKFNTLYEPITGKHKETLDSPLGADGQGGMSGFARQAYTMQVASFSKQAHKKMKAIEIKLEENRYAHFSTAVCAEVLKSKVHAIGDMQYEAKKKKVIDEMNKIKLHLRKRMQYDKADMNEKLAGYNNWASESKTAAEGGFLGRDAGADGKEQPSMMTEGVQSKTIAGQKGELVQAAHWAYAQQRTHNYEMYEKEMAAAKKRLEEARMQHDLTLCRTGRKPQSPELKYRLKKEKQELKQELDKLPSGDSAEVKEQTEKESATEKKSEKKAEEAKAEEKKAEEKPAELGESTADTDPHLHNELMYEFHNLVDASGGHETIAERAKMWKNLRNSEHAKEAALRHEFGLEHHN